MRVVIPVGGRRVSLLGTIMLLVPSVPECYRTKVVFKSQGMSLNQNETAVKVKINAFVLSKISLIYSHLIAHFPL